MKEITGYKPGELILFAAGSCKQHIVMMARVDGGMVYLYDTGTIRAEWDGGGNWSKETWPNPSCMGKRSFDECLASFKDMVERWTER